MADDITPAPVVEDPPKDPVVPDPDDKVPKKAYEEVMKDLQKLKQREREKDRELESAKAKAKELELQGMRAKEDYKAMYEDAENRFKSADTELKQTRQAIVDSTKWSSVSQELLKLGINAASLKHVEKVIDFNDIEVEVTSLGRVNVLNAKEFAETFKAQSPFYFQTGGKPNLNTNSPQVVVSATSVTMEHVKAAEAEWRKNRTPEAERKYKEALMAMKQKGMQ